jgi:hypothetical protein
MRRLSRLALRYGLSLPEFSRKVLIELEESFPADSFAEYDRSEELKASLERGIDDWRTGRVVSKL